MRWFKHLSLAHEDEGLSGILEELGVDGSRAYGIYWLILERVASTMDGKSNAVPYAVHSLKKWAEICHCSTRIFRAVLDKFSASSLVLYKVFPETSGERIQISVPKLLKYRDEYSKKSGHSPPIEQIEIEIESTHSPLPPSSSALAVFDPPLVERASTNGKHVDPDGCAEWCDRMYRRHPNKRDRILVEQECAQIWVDRPAGPGEIERIHALWVQTPEWRKENGRFAPRLANWLRDRGYLSEPNTTEDW